MSTLARFAGISIRVFSRERDPASFVVFDEKTNSIARIRIDDLSLMSIIPSNGGVVSRQKLERAIEWAAQHPEELRSAWSHINPDIVIPQIEKLEKRQVELLMQTLIIPDGKAAEGVLVKEVVAP
jgi:hypothetical protein